MRYKTKKSRLLALTQRWMQVHHKTIFTTNDVAEWAITNGVYPVPKRGDAEDICAAWEKKLLRIKPKNS